MSTVASRAEVSFSGLHAVLEHIAAEVMFMKHVIAELQHDRDQKKEA